MWSVDKIKTTLEAKFEDSKVSVHDLTGTSDHFQVTVISDEFEGLAPLERHRKVYAALGTDVGGSIHALSIKAYTPDQWKRMEKPETREWS